MPDEGPLIFRMTYERADAVQTGFSQWASITSGYLLHGAVLTLSDDVPRWRSGEFFCADCRCEPTHSPPE